MKTTILSLILRLLLYACNKDVVPAKLFCNVADPAEDLPWLKTIIATQQDNKYNKMLIFRYEYQQQEGFLVNSCPGSPDSLSVFYSCSGQNICEFGGKDSSNTCPDFFANSIKKELVFMDTIIAEKPSTYFCQVDNPLEDLVWLKTEVDEMLNNQRQAIIERCTYKGIEGFFINSCRYCSDFPYEFKNCSGERVCEFGGIGNLNTCPDFWEKRTNVEIIFEIE